MDPEIRELFDRLAELNADELTTLEGRIHDAFQAEDGKGADADQTVLAELVDAAEKVATRKTELAAEVAQAEADRAALRDRMAAVSGEEGTEGDGTEGDESSDEGTGDGSEEATAEATATATAPAGEGEGNGEGDEATTAAARQTARTAPRSTAEASASRPAAAAPRVENERHMSIVASADVRGHSAGTEMPDLASVGEAFASKMEAFIGTGGGAGLVPVATIQSPLPEEHSLTASAEENGRRIRTAMEDLEERMLLSLDDEAITAAGGLCAPVTPLYDLARISEPGRPVRDALMRFNADRGGARWITPPTLADVASGVAIWTHLNDVNPNDSSVPAGERLATKPCVTISCGTEQVAYVDAVTMCAQVGNFQRRTFAENFQTWYDLLLAQHDRVAEGKLLDGVYASSVKVTQAQVLGAVRDILDTYIRAGAQYRSRHRMARNATLTALLPFWLLDAIQADVTKQAPGDDEIGTTQTEIEGWFREANLDPHWYLDSRTGGGQVYPAQTAGALQSWIGTVEGALFHPGAFMFLDNGTLDLGVDIRDSGLISLNNVKAFSETFENIGFNGISSLWITNTICVSGQASGPVTVACA